MEVQDILKNRIEVAVSKKFRSIVGFTHVPLGSTGMVTEIFENEKDIEIIYFIWDGLEPTLPLPDRFTREQFEMYFTEA
jgi:hypothetical protein